MSTATASLNTGAETRGDRLARWAASVRWESLDGEVQAKLKAHVLDVVGVICAGLGTEHGLAAERGARTWGSDPECTVVGRSVKLPAAGAAFVNAFHARAHTYDDTYEEGPTHPGCSAVSAALACAEKAGASGPDFLAAALAGYEVTTRVSASVAPHHYNHGFHTTGTCNTFGAGAAACRAFGLNPEETLWGIGLAGEAAGGLRQYQISGSMADTSFDGARAAQSGVLAAQLAMAGLPGSSGVIDGPLGYCHVMSPKCDVERLDRDLGTRYEFMDTSIKPFPSCRCTHTPVGELLAMRARYSLEADAIEHVTIATFGHSIEVSHRPDVRSKFDAILSHQYCAALALAKGRLELADFSEERVADPAMRELVARIEVVHDPQLDAQFPSCWPHRIAIRLKDGRELNALADQPPGTRANPLDPSLVRDKFLSLATPVFGERRCGEIIAAVEGLDAAPGVDEFCALLSA